MGNHSKVFSSTKWRLGESFVLRLMECLTLIVRCYIFVDDYFTSFCLLTHIWAISVVNRNRSRKCTTLQIPDSLEDKFSHWDPQNQSLISHYEKKNRNHAKCFLFWENHVSLRIYLKENISNVSLRIYLKMSRICLINCFLSCKEQ